MIERLIVTYEPDPNASLTEPLKVAQIVLAEDLGVDFVAVVTHVDPSGFWFMGSVIYGKSDLGRSIEFNRGSVRAILRARARVKKSEPLGANSGA